MKGGGENIYLVLALMHRAQITASNLSVHLSNIRTKKQKQSTAVQPEVQDDQTLSYFQEQPRLIYASLYMGRAALTIASLEDNAGRGPLKKYFLFIFCKE